MLRTFHIYMYARINIFLINKFLVDCILSDEIRFKMLIYSKEMSSSYFLFLLTEKMILCLKNADLQAHV